jgi:hypothetical protein
MAASRPDAAAVGSGEAEALLPESDNSLLRRVVGGLQPARTWRRWFSRDEGEVTSAPTRPSASSQTGGERDIESGEPVSAAGRWRESGAESSAAAARGVEGAGSVSATPTSQGAAVEPAADSARQSSEITAAPPVAAAEAADATSGAAAASTPLVDSAERSAASGLSLGERVANLGQLLGLGGKSSNDVGATGGEDGGAKAGPGGLKGFLSGGSSDGAGARGLSRSSSGSQPMCLICLEPLTSEDFMSGEAISLDCQCRGDLALRHKACAIKWSRVKGDAVCDICKSQVANLPTPSPRASSPSGSDVEITIEDYAHGGAAMGMDAVPGNADMLFDCIRVTWVFMIICILFFEMQLSTALWSGIIAGIGYTLFVRAMYRQQLAAAAAEAARIAAGGSTPPPRAPPPILHHVVG